MATSRHEVTSHPVTTSHPEALDRSSHLHRIPPLQYAGGVVLFTRQGCHLCDEAALVLASHGLSARKVDIDRDPQLRELYTECVPVVVIDGIERFRGRVNEVQLRRLLAHRETD